MSEPLIGGAGQRQVQLPLRKAFAIAMQRIRVRLWRSMITAAGVLLGIAFLGATFTQMVLARHEPAGARAGLSERTAAIQAEEERMRQWWLVGVSLMVCTVGIANSMLMAVTERFKEIGTMKCLGALDSFIVKLFLIEAAVLGVAASALGFLLGFAAALVAPLIQLGGGLWTRLPAGEVLGWLLVSVVTGTTLTVLATIFPALQAARLPPAAALRSEV